MAKDRSSEASVKLELKFSQEDFECLQRFIELTKLSTSNQFAEELTLESLTQMLLQDVVYAMRRPGSWEGANMIQVLQSHGYLH